MNQAEIAKVVKSILINQFNISTGDFNWNKPLEILNEELGILGILLDLEELLKDRFGCDLSILNNIDAAFNTPMDIVINIKKQCFHDKK